MLSYTRRGQTSSLVVVFGHLFLLPWAKTNKESCCSTFKARILVAVELACRPLSLSQSLSKLLFRPPTGSQKSFYTCFLGYKAMKMPEDLALSHHYRICEFGGFDCLKKKSKTDNTAQRWGHQLVPRIKRVCEEIYGKSCPPAPPLGSPWWYEQDLYCL